MGRSINKLNFYLRTEEGKRRKGREREGKRKRKRLLRDTRNHSSQMFFQKANVTASTRGILPDSPQLGSRRDYRRCAPEGTLLLHLTFLKVFSNLEYSHHTIAEDAGIKKALSGLIPQSLETLFTYVFTSF